MNTRQERGNIYSNGLRVTGNSQAQAASDGESTEPSCGRPGLPSLSPPGPGHWQPEAAAGGATEPQPGRGCSARDLVVSRQ
jgi:hypothetical protein